MAARNTGMKCKLYIEQFGTGKVLAGQRNATFNRLAKTIEADESLIESNSAYQILKNAFINSENVVVDIELLSGKKYKGTCTITYFNLLPYDDLASYSISLKLKV